MDANVAAHDVRLRYFGCHRRCDGLSSVGSCFKCPRRPAASQSRTRGFSSGNQAGGATRCLQSPPTQEQEQEPVGLHDGRPKQVTLRAACACGCVCLQIQTVVRPLVHLVHARLQTVRWLLRY